MKNKQYKANSIQQQLLKRLFLVLVVLLLILGCYQHSSMKKYLYESKVEFLDSRFKNISKATITGTYNEDLLNKNKYDILYSISTEEVCAAVINSSGDIIGVKNKYTGIATDISKATSSYIDVPILPKSEYINLLSKKGMSSGYRVVEDKEGKEQIVIYREIGDLESPIGMVQISTYIDNINEILGEQARVYIMSSLAILLIGLALSLLVLKHTLKPLKNMTETLDTVDIKKLDLRLAENSGQIEIDKLSNKFNNMFDRLERSFIKEKRTNEKMKNFILDVSHELRTPLTSIQGFVEVLQMGAAKNEKQLELALDSILMESKRLSKLVNNLLLLAKLEQDVSIEVKKEDISKVIKEIIPHLQVLMNNRKLELDIKEKLYCNINKDQLKQVIYNIVQNSINYTSELDGVISISVSNVYKHNIEYVEICISDNGKGIPKDSLDYVFDRLYRVDKHRSRNKGGYGLGLSIVKQIVSNHNGHIDVYSCEGEGTTFKIYLKMLT
ncbi:MAG: sensor histidine kinase [Peptostreptococcaceae bacterium]